MPQANVIETAQAPTNQGQVDPIVETYKGMLDELGTLTEAERFWRETAAHEEFEKYIKKMRDEMAATRERWDNIKPADFKDSQARVLALKIVSRDLVAKAGDLFEQLRAKKRLIYAYEIDNEIILLGAGYEFEVAPEEAAPKEAGDADLDMPTEAMTPMDELEPLTAEGIEEDGKDDLTFHYDLTEAVVVTVIIPGEWATVQVDILGAKLRDAKFIQGSAKAKVSRRTYRVDLTTLTEGEGRKVQAILDEHGESLDEVRIG